MSKSSYPPPDEEANLSEYEKIRALNIERNNARLRALGLISALEEQQSNAFAWGKNQSDNDQLSHNDKSSEDHDDDDGEYVYDENKAPSRKGNKAKKRKRNTAPPSSPARKSARLQGLAPELMLGLGGGDEITMEQRQARVQECRQVRQRLALRVMNEGEAKAAKENPTATYEHCLMRVTTMTHKGLQNRVKSIERAAGKHCVVKMAIFKSCLQDENMWDLADLASAALERLKALQPPPDE